MNSLYDFIAIASELDQDSANSIDDTLVRLGGLLHSEVVPDRKKKLALKQLHAYLQRKCSELDPALSEARDADLRKIRNDLAHGRIRRDLDLVPLYPELWRAISRLGNRLGPSEIENLLAYTLGAPNMKASSRGASPTKVVSIYKPFFASLDPEDQRELFSELLLRLFTDSDSLSLLKTKRST